MNSAIRVAISGPTALHGVRCAASAALSFSLRRVDDFGCERCMRCNEVARRAPVGGGVDREERGDELRELRRVHHGERP